MTTTDPVGTTSPELQPDSVPETLTTVHMIGIGGAGMSGIARILLDHGVRVSGSDARQSAELSALADRGATVWVGHDATTFHDLPQPPEIVVVSKAAIPADNPELMAARQAGIPVVTRSQVLGHLARAGRSIMVCGTHGKTSTTSMLIAGMLSAGTDPSFAVGGTVLQFGTNARGGSDPVFVAEADESDGSLVHYTPDIVVLTNAEPDHLDHFGTADAYYRVFDTFLARIPDTGALVVCLDDEGARERARRAAARGVTIVGYGRAVVTDDDIRADLPLVGQLSDIVVGHDGTRAQLSLDAAPFGELVVGTPGEHMAFNAVAALLAARQLGVNPRGFLEGLANFGGVGRRFEHKGDAAGIAVYDDYAHHPTEVHAVLTAARNIVSPGQSGRLVAIFQPHMYSRTRIFATEFAQALSLADLVIVLDIYGARETPEPGVDSGLIVDAISVPVHRAGTVVDAVSVASELLSSGDVVLTIGAGTITECGPLLLDAVGERSP